MERSEQIIILLTVFFCRLLIPNLIEIRYFTIQMQHVIVPQRIFLDLSVICFKSYYSFGCSIKNASKRQKHACCATCFFTATSQTDRSLDAGRWLRCVPPRFWYFPTSPHSVTARRVNMIFFIAVRISNNSTSRWSVLLALNLTGLKTSLFLQTTPLKSYNYGCVLKNRVKHCIKYLEAAKVKFVCVRSTPFNFKLTAVSYTSLFRLAEELTRLIILWP